MSGIKGLTQDEKGTLVVTMIRSTICYGLEARGVTPKDLHMFEHFDGKVIRLASCQPLWKMKETNINMDDIRFELMVPPLPTAIHYRKATYFGHTMRRDNSWLPKLVLTGSFFPSHIDEQHSDESDYYFDSTNNITDIRSSSIEKYSVLQNAYRLLTIQCKIPNAALQWLLNPEHS